MLKDLVSDLPRHAISDVAIVKLAPDNPFVYKVYFIAPYFDIVKNYTDLAQKVAKDEKKEVAVEDKEVNDTLEWLRKNYNLKLNESLSEGEKQKDLPELNDDFAKTVGKFDNMNELKKSIYDGIHLEKEKKEKDRIRIAIIKEIADNSKKEIPKEVIARESGSVESEFKDSIAQMGLEFDDYMAKINKKREDFEPGWQETAKERIEVALVLDAIADQEGIKPSDEEVAKEMQKVLARYANVKEAEEQLDPDRVTHYIYSSLRNEKTLEFLENL